MSDNKRESYPSEFKESAVKLAIESKNPIAQTARELGVKVHTLYAWIKLYSTPKGLMVRTDQHIYDENKRLKKELARVTQERDLLKKAASYFAREA
jgi:transposase